MNKIKSLFIGIYPMYAMGVSAYATYSINLHGFNYIWVGAILITLPLLIFFTRLMVFQYTPRTSEHLPFLTILALLGMGFSSYGFYRSEMTEIVAFCITLIGFLTFFLYNFWYSSLGRTSHHKLEIGKLLPNFKVTDIKGETLKSSSFVGTPLILMFFRGNWCPLCMAQVKEIANLYKRIDDLGANVALVAPQPEKNTQKLAKKHDVPFIFLTDKDNHAAKILGIEMKNGLPAGMEVLGYDKDTVYPTLIITDKEGKIVYTDFTNNYRIRPDPEDFLKVLEQIKTLGKMKVNIFANA